MEFNGSEGGQIPQNDAIDTRRYRNQNPGDVLGHFMGRDILLQILNQAGCMGIRTYYGIDANNEKQIVMVGADTDTNDMTNGIIADLSTPCPHTCPISSLNSE